MKNFHFWVYCIFFIFFCFCSEQQKAAKKTFYIEKKVILFQKTEKLPLYVQMKIALFQKQIGDNEKSGLLCVRLVKKTDTIIYYLLENRTLTGITNYGYHKLVTINNLPVFLYYDTAQGFSNYADTVLLNTDSIKNKFTHLLYGKLDTLKNGSIIIGGPLYDRKQWSITQHNNLFETKQLITYSKSNYYLPSCDSLTLIPHP